MTLLLPIAWLSPIACDRSCRSLAPVPPETSRTWQHSCSHAAERGASNSWFVILSEGEATEYGTALRVRCDSHAVRGQASHCSRKMNAALEASRARHKFAVRGSSCCDAGRTYPPVLPGCGERVTISGNERR